MKTNDRNEIFKILKENGVLYGNIKDVKYKITFDDELLLFKLEESGWELETSYNWGVLMNRFENIFETEEELLTI
jgi:hypothetical protein